MRGQEYKKGLRGGTTMSDNTSKPVDRRSFLGKLGLGTAASVALGSVTIPRLDGGLAHAAPVGPMTDEERRLASLDMRRDMAQVAFDRPTAMHPTNGDEEVYPARFANYSKGLPHNSLGEVEPAAYDALLAALTSANLADFEAIPLGGGRTLTNPQSGLAYDLEGSDAWNLSMAPHPPFASAWAAGEMVELYWMALLRDVSFTDFGSNRLVGHAARDLTRLTDLRAPKQDGMVTPETIFRGDTPGDLAGPYVSQFLLREIPYGSLTISQRQGTVVGGLDYGTRYDEWLNIQNGGPTADVKLDPQRRYIRNMRDLTRYVQIDALYEAYLNACLILLGMGAPVDPGNPYAPSANQHGFGTFGGPHILSLVTEVATRALKAVWYQKWFVHRRLRGEEFGGRVHNHLAGRASYPIHEDLLGSEALDFVKHKNGTWLLPLAFPEGSPTHPSYGAGHATVAGACVTILKAWFDESHVMPNPVVPNPGGQTLVPYEGDDAGSLTVGGELNKVAANVAFGRNMAGIHYRTDYSESVKLGERIAICILEEQKPGYNENSSLSLTTFDGTAITI